MKIAFGCILAEFELPYVKEFIGHYFSMGFNTAYVWLNNWSPESLAYLKNTDFGGECIFKICNGDCLQLAAYNDIISRAMSDNVDWLFVCDGDEFLKIHSDRKLEEILAQRNEVPSLAINWRLFGSNGKLFTEQEKDGVVKTFTRCGREKNMHIKTFLHLSLLKNANVVPMFNADPHHTNIVSYDLDGNIILGPWNKANLDKVSELEINHYVVKSFQSFLLRRSFKRADCGTPRRDLMDFWFQHDKNEIDASELRYK